MKFSYDTSDWNMYRLCGCLSVWTVRRMVENGSVHGDDEGCCR